MTEQSAAPSLAELPEQVRVRVIALSAQVLPDVVRLPPALRRFSSFAPQRRARLGARAIGEALEADPEFRGRVATQLGIGDGAARGPEDEAPAEVAARAWLSRGEGWPDQLAEAIARLEEQPAVVADQSLQLDQLRAKLADAEQAGRDLRAEHRAAIEEKKTENAALRRKVGEARAVARTARSELEELTLSVAEERREVESRTATQDKELRQLRAQLADRAAENSADRRAVRSERDDATVRARLLLETVLEAASGLRRELGLPSGTTLPADRIEAELADDVRLAGAAARAASSPAVLEQYLGLPRARLLIDGYNVSMLAWPSSSLEAQRIRLLNALAPVVARTGVDATVVFDAADSSTRPVVASPRGVKVVFSPLGVIADDVLRDLVGVEPVGRVVLVVSNDQEVVADVVRRGARSVASDVLIGLLNRSG